MGDLDIANISQTDLKNQVGDFEVDYAELDGVLDQEETEYMNNEWSKQLGAYRNKKAPELSAVIDARANWTTGRGYDADPETKFNLGLISGNGTDTFTTILENASRMADIGGDFYAEKVKNDRGLLINLKPLDTGRMKIITNGKGILIRYEYMRIIKKDNGTTSKAFQKFKPEEIFHISRNRTGDETHGQSLVEILMEFIEAKSELFVDWGTMLHRNVFPVRFLELDSDDPTEIARVKREYEVAQKNGEVIIIPKGTITMANAGLAPNSTINGIPSLQYYDDQFYQAANTPKIIVGGVGGVTDAAVKIAYMTFAQTIRARQLFFNDQVAVQLGFTIKLIEPATLENDLLTDSKKDGPTNIQPNEAAVNEVVSG